MALSGPPCMVWAAHSFPVFPFDSLGPKKSWCIAERKEFSSICNAGMFLFPGEHGPPSMQDPFPSLGSSISPVVLVR